MSGIVQNNTVRSSGTIAVAAAGLNWDSAVITASTLTAEGGNGYFINTSSNICTITLPSAAEVGDQIVFVDYARTWGTNKIVIDSNGLNYQGNADTFIIEYNTSGETLDIVYSGSSKGWIPQNDDVVVDAPVAPPTQKGIFGFGSTGGGNTQVGVTNLVNSSGAVASDVSAVGTARNAVGAVTYGFDKAIFAFGRINDNGNNFVNTRNLVNNSGVVASDATGAGTARLGVTGAKYGFDKAIFAFGSTGSVVNTRNLVSNSGVVAADATGAGTARNRPNGVGYGTTGQAIYAFGYGSGYLNVSNLVTNQGVVGSDVSGVGTARVGSASSTYGTTGQAIFVYGGGLSDLVDKFNLVTNVGVVGSDQTAAGTKRQALGGTSYGGDKGIVGFGEVSSKSNLTNKISSSGVVASNTSGVGTARDNLAAAGYSNSA